jgi:CheY-like chemotaxis protein
MAIASRPKLKHVIREAREPDVKPRILVVDDKPDIRKFPRTVLSRRGFEVATAESGGQALEVLRLDAMLARLTDELQQVLNLGYTERARVRRTAIGEAQLLLRQVS